MAGDYDLILRGGRVALPGGIADCDVAVSGGRIAAIGAVPGRAAREIDARGLIVTPGGVDPHAHIEQRSGMGLMNADSFETATRAALIGGTTTVISFAAQEKGEAPSTRLADYAGRAARGAMADHAFHLTLTDPGVPGFAGDVAALIAAGHRSLKLFTTYDIRLGDREILEIMALARRHGALVCVHAENHGLIGFARDRLLAAGRTRPADHVPSHPRLAEVEAVHRLCRFAEYLGQPVMIFHVSTAEGVETVRAARARGAPVWAETCPHYLMMDAEALDRPGLEGAKWMCSPPQRTEADRAALWAALTDGTLSLVSSDHAPYRFDRSGKLAAGPAPDFAAIANGLPGLETRLPLLFSRMVAADGQGAEHFAEVTAAAPARLYGLPGKGAIAPGMDGDLVLWDPARTHVYGADDLHDNVGYNPWEGTRVQGWPETVILRGQVVVESGACTASPGQGRFIDRPAPGTARAVAPAAEIGALVEVAP